MLYICEISYEWLDCCLKLECFYFRKVNDYEMNGIVCGNENIFKL